MELTKNCTGCMACYNKCSNNAISIVYNEAGFYTPQIDETKCTNCELCAAVCPQIKEPLPKEEPKVCYAVMTGDEIRKNSASGGVFALIAQQYLKKGGYVCGAAFSEDFRKVNHIIINDEKDLIRLQNSKYVQSNIGNVFSEIRILLENGKEVLFSGTPCQVAGLNSYLGKYYNNLLTIDLVCNNIPSPLVWEKYINEIAQGKKIIKASFRNKKYTWHASQILEFTIKKGLFSETVRDDLYYRGFLEHLIINKACSTCKYTNLQRPSDLTIGDFWGIEKFETSMDDKKGTSLLIINTPKGQNTFDSFLKNFGKYKEFNIQAAVIGNPNLKSPSELHINQENFIKNLHKLPVIKNMKEGLCPQYEGIIRNFWAYNNFGATLSAYAIQQFFKQKGKDYYILKTHYPVDYTKPFADKYLKTTHLVSRDIHYKELNKCTNNFILGTDQILRQSLLEGSIDKALYGYTNFKKKRVVFSGSFGLKKLENMGWLNNLKYSKLIKRFDAISTREVTGVDICKKAFNINAEYIIDPVFLISKNKWLEMAPDTKDKYCGKIVCYIFDMFGAKSSEVREYLEKKYNKEVIMLTNAKIPVEEFISAIKDADAIVTNSFHGTCFALIFNKKLLAITNSATGDARFDSLINLFDIKHLAIDTIDDIYTKKELFCEYDYNYFLSVLEQERIRADIWFEQYVNSKKQITWKNIIAELDYQIFLYLEKILNFWINMKFYYFCYKNNSQVVFWGASIYLDNLLSKNPKIAKNIIGIVDNNPAWHYKKFHGCTIYPPEKLTDLKPKLVVSTIKNNHEKAYQEIKKYLKEKHPSINLMQDIFN